MVRRSSFVPILGVLVVAYALMWCLVWDAIDVLFGRGEGGL